MNSELKSKVLRYFSEKLNTYGTTPKGVDWNDAASQALRFEQLLKVIDAEGGVTLNDLGCGYGGIFLYKDTAKRLVKYYGYDICEDMLIRARQLIRDNKATFINSDRITKEADYSIASGIFNAKTDIDVESWEKFILDTLSNMNEKSLKGFSFNCITTYVDYRRDHLYYADPLFYFNFCKRNFSRYVTLIHDYPLYEWTMIVKKKA